MTFAGLLDDAALFPPGNAPMAGAVPAHRRHRDAWYAGLVGPFLVPAARLDELAAHLPEDGEIPLDLGLIAAAEALPAALAAVGAERRLALVAVEVAPSQATAAAVVEAVRQHVPEGVAVAVGVPRGPVRPGFLDALAGTGLRAKLRTGGTEAAAFPDERELAEAIAACRARAMAFKCTAGLHHAVRHTGEGTGFAHHGYLNILLAAEAAERGADADTVAGLLAERSPEAVVVAVAALSDDRRRAARSLFTSFGTCSITEPVDDLVALGLLAPMIPERTR
ncbi:hypothetical protein [Pseudonocardia nigra]|uniref:hypothetical protein n=1 Tax=Pseudonocardia nigra TaxID=1921578 RepID=UPI0027E2B3B8|nr:hypothetical protein [Pseudonocardia nigra]